MPEDVPARPAPDARREDPGARPRIEALTGVRAVAAFWVFLHHIDDDLIALLPGLAFIRPFADAGFMGVDLFFILSGFIISYNYIERLSPLRARTYADYVWLRLGRIYPVHVTAIAVLALLVGLAAWMGYGYEPAGYTGTDLALNLLLVDAWGTGRSFAWNIPSWSISAEWFAYLLVFPLCALALPRLRSRTTAAVATAAVLAFLGLGFPWFGFGRLVHLVRIAGEFTVGCLLFRIYSLRARTAFRWSWTDAVLPAVIIAAVWWGRPHTMGNFFWLVPAFAVWVYLLAVSTGPAARVLASAPAVYMGRVSYAFYMTHALSRKVLKTLLPPESMADRALGIRLATIALYLFVSAAVAALMYHLVEEPARRWMRRLRPAGTERSRTT